MVISAYSDADWQAAWMIDGRREALLFLSVIT